MAQLEIKSFDKPDETCMFEGKGLAEVVSVLGRPVARGRFEPGWRWSVNVEPIAQTEQCDASQFIGDETCVFVDFGENTGYAKRRA